MSNKNSTFGHTASSNLDRPIFKTNALHIIIFRLIIVTILLVTQFLQ